MSFPARRSLLNLLVTAAVAAASLLVAASAGSAASAAKPTLPPSAERPAKADRDGNKVFDDLEARLAALSADERVSVLVALAHPATAERVDSLARSHGGFAVTRRFSVVQGFAATVTKGQAIALSHVPWVVHVEENSTVRASNSSAQDSFGVTKARTDAPSLDGDGDGSLDAYSKSDLVAAVIDTGIHAGHLDLDEGKVIAFKDFVGGQTAPYDDNGHGTHVAATIAGDGDARADRLYKGVAPGAALVGAKVLAADGSGTMENVTAAIDWVVQNKDLYGIEAINLSLGASGCSDGTDLSSQAVNNAHAAGLVVAVAAGNDGPGTCRIGSPGAARDALTVGAMADLGVGGFTQASFSSRGNTADGRVKPDVSAPGVNITSAQTNSTSGYVTYSGTSMATPFVAGVALLMRDANATLSPQQVKDAVSSTASDWGPAGRDLDYGAGRLDAYAALKAAGGALSSAPAVPAHEYRAGSLSGTGARVDYTFEVVDTAFPVGATLIIPALTSGAGYNPDFDLYLYDPAGRLVASSERIERQEDVTFRPTATGKYTVRVSSYSGSGSFFVDVSGGFGTATAPAPAPTPAPTTVTASPSSVSLYSGSLRSGDATRLAANDDANLEINSTTKSGTRLADWYGRITGVANALKSLQVSYAGKSSASCEQRLFVYDWTNGYWVRVDSRTIGTSEGSLTVTLGGTLANYVSGGSGDGEVALRVRCMRGDSLSFYTSTDLLQIAYEK